LMYFLHYFILIFISSLNNKTKWTNLVHFVVIFLIELSCLYLLNLFLQYKKYK